MLPKVTPSGNVRGSSLKSPMIDFTFRAVVFSGRPLFVFKNNEPILIIEDSMITYQISLDFLTSDRVSIKGFLLI